jgi:hypothetical protein
VVKRTSAKFDPRDVAAEIVKSALSRGECPRGGHPLPYVVRRSDPPAAHEQLQLVTCKMLGRPVAIMPAKCRSVQEWSERYGKGIDVKWPRGVT